MWRLSNRYRRCHLFMAWAEIILHFPQRIQMNVQYHQIKSYGMTYCSLPFYSCWLGFSSTPWRQMWWQLKHLTRQSQPVRFAHPAPPRCLATISFFPRSPEMGPDVVWTLPGQACITSCTRCLLRNNQMIIHPTSLCRVEVLICAPASSRLVLLSRLSTTLDMTSNRPVCWRIQ